MGCCISIIDGLGPDKSRLDQSLARLGETSSFVCQQHKRECAKRAREVSPARKASQVGPTYITRDRESDQRET